MTWKSHQAVTFTTLLAMTGNVFAAGCGALGSTFPDVAEGPLWRYWHRGLSHWWAIYAPALALFYLKSGRQVFIIDVWQVLFWFCAGALLHILEDSVCGKIPLFLPGKRIQVFPRLFYVGSYREGIFVLAYCVIMFFIIFGKYWHPVG